MRAQRADAERPAVKDWSQTKSVILGWFRATKESWKPWTTKPIAPSSSHQPTPTGVRGWILHNSNWYSQSDALTRSSSWARGDRMPAKSYVLKVNSFMMASISEEYFSPLYREDLEFILGESLNTWLTLSSSQDGNPGIVHLQSEVLLWAHLLQISLLLFLNRFHMDPPAMVNNTVCFDSISLFASLQCCHLWNTCLIHCGPESNLFFWH